MVTRYLSRTLLLLALFCGTALPGLAAYTGAYIALVLGALALVIFGWPERAAFSNPTARAILAAIALVSATLPFVYQGEADLMAPVFILPMLVSIALGLLARPVGWMPSASVMATVCLVAALVALVAGAYESAVLGVRRVGLGNNPIHYGTLAAMVGGMALVGVVAVQSRWRYFFLLGPILGIGAATLSGSRGPLVGALALAGMGTLFLVYWYRADRLMRVALLITIMIGAAILVYLLATGNARVTRIVSTAMNIFQFTGGSDDIRAALYGSAIHVLHQSPVFGVGFGQIMQAAQELYPEQRQVFRLENLHADWANFAAMAGSLGLLSWLLLLAAPVLLLVNKAARRDRPIVLGAVLLVTGQATLGVSNAMFGVLPQTVMYAVLLGYLFARARRLAMMEQPVSGA